MAELSKIERLRGLIEAYGAAVRAGLITPCLADENEFRSRLGLREATGPVVSAWSRSSGVRSPVTLQRPSDAERAGPAEGDENDPTPPQGEQDE